MQVPGAQHFGRHHPLESLARLLEENAVVEQAGQVENAAQRRHHLADVGQQSGNFFPMAHVAAADHDTNAGLFQLFELRLRLRRGARPSHEHQVAGPAISQPAGDFQAQAAQAAGDQVRGILAERHAPVRRVAVGGGPNHHFADVFGTRHAAQRVDGALHVKRPQRQGIEFLLRELGEHFAQQPTDALRLFGHHLIQGDGVERQARLDGVHPALVPEVGLAEFQETSAGA